MAVPVIIDCDPGHDDVFAIWLAAGDPDVDLRAITTVAGNVGLEHTTQNALAACSVAGISGVPVAAGAGRPLTREPYRAADIHGANGLGGVPRPDVTVPLDPRTASELTLEVLDQATEPVTVVATGPLTNLALLLLERPGSADRIGSITWMGGSTERGNSTPYAEFNAYSDPQAADVVVRSGIPFTMVGLNITNQTFVTDDILGRIASIGNRTSAFGLLLLERLILSYEKAYRRRPPIHDAVAVALAAHPEIATSMRSRLDVELVGAETFGATSVDLHDRLRREQNAIIALDLEVKRFWDLLLAAMSELQ